MQVKKIFSFLFVILLSLNLSITSITINLDRKAGQPVRLSFHLMPKLQ